MLYIYPNIVESVKRFVQRKWPDKKVSCQENENAWHQNRFISISVSPYVDMEVIHYEYINGYLELHLEGEYYGDPFNQHLYKYLRNYVDTKSGDFLWHNWYGMKQGLLRLEYPIEDTIELSDCLVKFIGLIDPLIADYMEEKKAEVALDEQMIGINAIMDFDDRKKADSSIESEGEEEADSKVTLETMSLKEVFSLNLRIPDYQRIYSWPQKNVELLLDDILTLRGHKYHLGTIILQKKGLDYDIIDGQQRTITLALFLRAMGFPTQLLNEKIDSVEAQKYVGYNRYIIELYLNRVFPDTAKRLEVAERILDQVSFDVLVLQDSSLDLAYTFFSTQNARGKALTDYELLKSHHLRYIPDNNEAQQRHLAKMWDSLLVKSERDNGDRSVSIIMGIYIYCLRKWTNNHQWYIKEPNRVKNEFEAAPIIDEIPPFGEKFDFMDPIQGGTHFFAFVNKFIQHYHLFTDTSQYRILRETISCSGMIDMEVDDGDGETKHLFEMKKRTHWWYGDVIATFLFAYYLKFGNLYLSEALTCITRIVSQLRYDKSKANKQSIMNEAANLGIMGMINQATSPTFFLARARDVIKRLPLFNTELKGIREGYFECEKSLYHENEKHYLIDSFKLLHNK